MRLVYQFLEHLMWVPKFKKVKKRKTNVLHKNKKLLSVTVSSKLNIESEHINTVNNKRLTVIISTLIVLYSFHVCVNTRIKKVRTNCPEFSTILKVLPLYLL